MSESDLQSQVADYLRLQYPDVMFHSDFGSGIKLTPGQAAKQKRQNGGRRAWPDMFIAETSFIIPRGLVGAQKYDDCHWVCFPHRKGEAKKPALVAMCGLFIELKKEGEKLYPGPRSHPCNRFKSIDGKEYRTQHLCEQADVLKKLRERGYCAEFAVGFEEAKRIIDTYLA